MVLDVFSDPSHISTLLSVVSLQTLAVISPGPDFAVVTRNSILHSRRTGIFTALGISVGVLFHISYLVLGFGVLVAGLSKALFWVKVAGCLYLIYIGWQGLRSSSKWESTAEGTSTALAITAKGAFWNGFLTNVLNPKAILFLLSLFTIVIGKNTPPQILFASGGLIFAITLVWFLLVSLCFSGSLRDYFLRFGMWIDRLTGGFLIFIGTKIGLTCFD